MHAKERMPTKESMMRERSAHVLAAIPSQFMPAWIAGYKKLEDKFSHALSADNAYPTPYAQVCGMDVSRDEIHAHIQGLSGFPVPNQRRAAQIVIDALCGCSDGQCRVLVYDDDRVPREQIVMDWSPARHLNTDTYR